jgi:uncharacterized protein YbaR (Trm112 family)
MSKKLLAIITCPKCNNQTDFSLFRTLWIEDASNRELVFSDRVNYFTCSCGHSERLEFPLLCTNVKKKFAVWYEPEQDDQIDVDAEMFKKHMGADSFYARAPRIKNWKEFKERILLFEQSINSSKVIVSHSMKDMFKHFISKINKKT